MAAPASASPHRVLFVDDDPRFLETIQELMAEFCQGQWQILTAGNASQAFALMQAQTVDLVVLDVEMQVLDGIQVLSLLNRSHPHVQKAVLTGFANEKYRAACLANGAELFLEKPTTAEGWDGLHAALKALLDFPPEKGFRGVLRRVGLADLIQMECLGRGSSVLEVSDGHQRGEIYVEDGQIIHAQVGERTGEDAFNHLLGLRGGQFHSKPLGTPPARTISSPWEFLLMEAARQHDEARAAEGEPPAELPVPPPPPAEVPQGLSAADGAEEASALSQRPRIAEVLICSAGGDVVYEWQCRDRAQWITLFEFFSRKGRRLAQHIAFGAFDRLEIVTGTARLLLLLSADRGVFVRSERRDAAAGPTPTDATGQDIKEIVTGWLHDTPAPVGVALRCVAFPEHGVTCDAEPGNIPRSLLGHACRDVSDAYEVLEVHGLQPECLKWTYEHVVVYCTHRSDGLVLAAMVPRSELVEEAALTAMLNDFRALPAA